MVLVIAPEPCDWLAPLVRVLQARERVIVFAPWAVPGWLPRWPAVSRRSIRDAAVHSLFPAYLAVEAAVRLYARGRAARSFRARFALRRAVDAMVGTAFELGAWPDVRCLVAPTLTARRGFVAAGRRGIRRVLIEDQPDLVELARSLDRHAVRWPDCPFLRNHRPSRNAIVEQAFERELADDIGVRGSYAWLRLAASHPAKLFGVPIEHEFPTSPRPRRAAAIASPRLLLAGPAVARSGTPWVPELLDRLPTATIVVRPAEGHYEPAALLDHPRVAVATDRDRSLEDVDLVLALSIVESHLPEVRLAIERGIPVIGTAEALGLLDPSTVPVRLDDLDLLAERIGAALTSGPPPTWWKPPRGLDPAVRPSAREHGVVAHANRPAESEDSSTHAEARREQSKDCPNRPAGGPACEPQSGIGRDPRTIVRERATGAAQCEPDEQTEERAGPPSP